IKFVKDNASCAVLVSGRGNNFVYVSTKADWEKAKRVIINAKTHKTSACNALDNVLIDKNIPDLDTKLKDLRETLVSAKVDMMAEEDVEKPCLKKKPCRAKTAGMRYF